MTPEERKKEREDALQKYLKELAGQTKEDVAISRLKSFFEEKRTEYDFEQIHVAIDAMEWKNKYRWHDLRKNPNDLPEDDAIVEVAIAEMGFCLHEAEYCEREKAWYARFGGKLDDVTAWRKIEPPFNGDDNKYAWHDMIKCPDDLPVEGIDVLCCAANGDYHVCTSYSVIPYKEGRGLTTKAWRYIEPFEDESNA